MDQPYDIAGALSVHFLNGHFLSDDYSVEQMKLIVTFLELYRELFPIESLVNKRFHGEEEKMLEQGWEYWSRLLEANS